MATITINTTSAEDARIVVAFGHFLGLPGNATQAQVKTAVSDWVTGVVMNDEKRVASLSAANGVIPIAPT